MIHLLFLIIVNNKSPPPPSPQPGPADLFLSPRALCPRVSAAHEFNLVERAVLEAYKAEAMAAMRSQSSCEKESLSMTRGM